MSTESAPQPTNGLSAAGEVPPRIRERVTIAAPEPWVEAHEIDEEDRPQHACNQAYLLIDTQHHTASRASFQRIVQRLETLQGVQNLSQWSLNFDPDTQHVIIHSIAIRRGGQVTEHACAERLRFFRREQQMERLVIDGAWTVVLLLENVQLGDLLDFSYTVVTQPRLLGQRYSVLECLPCFVPVRSYCFSIQFPPDASDMKWTSSPGLPDPEARDIGGETRWKWTFERIPADPFESSAPAWHSGVRYIHVSDCLSWNEIAVALEEAWQTGSPQPGTEAFAKMLFSGIEDPGVGAARAIEFVQDEVRYLSLNEDLGGQIPTAPDVTLQRRFGDCKDKTLLLVRLLRHLGLEARPVLVNTCLRGDVAKMLPSPNLFNHAIVEFTLEGQRHWVDPTSILQGGGVLRRPLPEFKAGLAIAPDTQALTPIEGGSQKNTYMLRESFWLNTAGGQTVMEVHCAATGVHAESLRCSLAMEGAEAVSKRREQFYRNLFPEISRIGTPEWKDNRAGNELKLTERYDLGQPYAKGQNPQLCHLGYHSHVVQSLLALPPGDKTRKYPLLLGNEGIFAHNIEFHTPTMHEGALKQFHKASGAFIFDQEVRKLRGRWIWFHTVKIQKSIVEADSFDAHRSDLLELWPTTGIHLDLPVNVEVSSGLRRAKTPAPVVESWEPAPQLAQPHRHRSRHRVPRYSFGERLQLALPALSLALLVLGLLACICWVIWG